MIGFTVTLVSKYQKEVKVKEVNLSLVKHPSGSYISVRIVAQVLKEFQRRKLT
jgi:hypothetical protein